MISRAVAASQSVVSPGAGSGRGIGPSGTVTEGAPAAAPTALLVERLRLIGGAWEGGKLAAGNASSEFETELPPMLIRLVKGPPPKNGEWFLCPLVIANVDAYGSDFASKPIPLVLLRTSMSPLLCTLRGVRLVTYT